MSSLHLIITSFFDLALSPFQSLSPLWALTLFSLLTSFLMLLVFRYTSDQQRIRETKNRIKAHILELWLFRDDLWIMLSAQGQILRLNGRYLTLAVKPMLVMIAPMALMLISLESWFGYRPLRPGEVAIVSVRVGDGEVGVFESASLQANNGVRVETPPLRIAQFKEINWRIRAHRPGVHRISVGLSGGRLEKEVVVALGLARVSTARVRSGLWQALLHPTEAPIPHQLGVERIDIRYPARSIRVFGWDVHWLVYFFVLSIVSVFALKRFFGVEV